MAKKPSAQKPNPKSPANAASKDGSSVISTKVSYKRPSRGLGKGLSALMADVAPAIVHAEPLQDGAGNVDIALPVYTSSPDSKEAGAAQNIPSSSAAQFIRIDYLERNPAQPRRYFDPVKLEDLTRSISQKGILQPILARPIKKKTPSGDLMRFQIVAGERRWQAAMKAGLDQMPVMVRELSDQEVLEIGVVENVQRANLNPIEEAQAYRALADEFGRRQEDIANAVGKSRSHVANMMRLLTLPDRAQDLPAQGKLSAGHARAVISAPDPAALAELIVQKDLSVREAESMIRNLKKGEPLRAEAKTKSADVRKIEKDLTDKLGLKVELVHKNPSGKLIIHYKTDGQLERMINRLPKAFD